MPSFRVHGGAASVRHHLDGEAAKETLSGTLCDAVKTGIDGVFQELADRAKRNAEEDCASLLAEAKMAASELTAVAKEEASSLLRQAQEARAAAGEETAEMKTEIQRERRAIEHEKAAMKKAHTFQTNKIILDVGGHKFATSRQTLTSIPDTYFASLFSGRFELAPDAEGAYFIDRDGEHFRHILNFLRDFRSFKLSSDLSEGQKDELAVEVAFYTMLDHMMPFHAQERVGQALLQRACLAGTKCELQTAMAQSRVLTFDIGSTTPFLSDEFQDLRFVITDRVLNESPVWAAKGGKWFMYRDMRGHMMISDDTACIAGSHKGYLYNTMKTAFPSFSSVAPTDLPSNKWKSNAYTTLKSQYASAKRAVPGDLWVLVPDIRITTVYGLDDGDPAMVAALQQLAKLA